VSVYVPSGGNINDTITQIFQEKGTASNIKSKNTRKNVLTALEKMIQHLRLFKQTPPNGLVVFCGNISPVEGKEDIKIWSFEPPVKMMQKVYWCDQTFVVEPLQDLIAEKEVYGLITLDAKEATLGLLRGKQLETAKRMESTVPSKSVKGGMSQSRYDGIREDALNEFFRKVADKAAEIFLKEKNLVGVIIGGPGPTKETFYREKYLNYQIQNKILGVKDIGYTGPEGLDELLQRSQDLLKEAAIAKERSIMAKFYQELKAEGNVVYGYTETDKAIDAGAVEILLISEDFNWVHVKLRCADGHEKHEDLPLTLAKVQKCEEDGKTMEIVEEQNLDDVLTEKATHEGAKIQYISTSTPEGKQFKELGGIAAFLRYKITSSE
jgi:peptide chain release factor subunit 1